MRMAKVVRKKKGGGKKKKKPQRQAKMPAEHNVMKKRCL